MVKRVLGLAPLKRFMYFVLGLSLQLVSFGASAEVVYYAGALPTIGYGSDGPAACAMLFELRGWYQLDRVNYNPNTGEPTNCQGKTKSTSTTTVLANVIKRTCVAPTPTFDPATTTCVAAPPPSCKAGEKGTGTWYHSTGSQDEVLSKPDYVPPFVNGLCVGSCLARATDIKVCYLATDGKNYCKYDWMTTGEQCTPGSSTPPPQTNPPPVANRTDVPPFTQSSGSCPKGTVQGGTSADGVPICIGTGSDPKNSAPPPPKTETSKTEATSDGGTKTTNTTITTNADGSKTTTTTTITTAADGTKTTNTTKDTTPSTSGSAGKDDSAKDDEKYDLCKQNPKLNICRNSTVSGACGAVTCTGDAIQCATLRAAAIMQCEQAADKDALGKRPEVTLGNSILSGADPMKGAIDTALKGQTVDFGATSLDQAGFVAASCLGPRSFQALGQTITVSFDSMCSNIQPIRYFVLACAFVVAYLIVSRAALET